MVFLIGVIDKMLSWKQPAKRTQKTPSFLPTAKSRLLLIIVKYIFSTKNYFIGAGGLVFLKRGIVRYLLGCIGKENSVDTFDFDQFFTFQNSFFFSIAILFPWIYFAFWEEALRFFYGIVLISLCCFVIVIKFIIFAVGYFNYEIYKKLVFFYS